MFEYTGGEVPAKVFEKMPNGSVMHIVGNLSHENIPINSGNILFQDKKIEAFYLLRWYASVSESDKAKWFKLVSDDLRDGGKIFGTQIHKTISLSQVLEGGIQESVSTATDGKTLIQIE